MKCPTIPAPRASAPPAPPESGPASALAPAHWQWTDTHYEWVPPAWLPRPPHPHRPNAPALWQDGYWTPDAGACVWTAGGFVS